METYDNVVERNEKKEKINVVFCRHLRDGNDECKSKKIKISDGKNEAKILDSDYEMANNLEKDEKDDDANTFRLVEESSLFSQLSENKLQVQKINSEHQDQENPCKVVEVKAGEIMRSVVTAVESLVVPGPDDVEMVQIIDDTDTEPESNSPAFVRRLLKQKDNIESESSEENISKKLHSRKDEETIIKPKRLNSDGEKNVRHPSKIPKSVDKNLGNSGSDKNEKKKEFKESSDETNLTLVQVSNDEDFTKSQDPKIVEEHLKQEPALEKYPKPFNYEKNKLKRKGADPVLKKDVSENKETDKDESRGKDDTLKSDVPSSPGKIKDKEKTKPKTKLDSSDTDYDSFYGSDKDNDEELVFSEDDNILDNPNTESTVSDDDDDDDDVESFFSEQVS